MSELVDAKLKELQPYFPSGLHYEVAHSTTPFVKISIQEVVQTLIEAIVLAALAAQDPQAELQLKADTAVPYGRVVQVMGWAHAAGLGRIGFVAQPVPAAAP